jgi:hypothetical protein
MLAVGVRSSYEMDLSQADDIIPRIAAFDLARYG